MRVVVAFFLTVLWTSLVVPTVAPAQSSAPSEDGTLRYELRFEGLDEESEVRSMVEAVSGLKKRVDDPPVSRAALNRRIEVDLDRFRQVARSAGYYDARFAVEDDAEEVSAEELQMVVRADLGTVYRYGSVEIVAGGAGGSAIGVAISRRDLGLLAGEPARAEDVLAAEAVLLRSLQEQAFPLAAMLGRTVTIDRDTKVMAIRYEVDPGRRARFGSVTVEGLATLDERFVLRRLPWVYGDPADIRGLERGRRALAETGLFESVAVAFAEQVSPDGSVAIRVAVDERERRSIGAGVSASTSEGVGSTAFWTHRNLFGGAERLTLEARYGEVERGLSAALTFRDVFANDQDFTVSSGFAERSTDGFDSTGFTLSGHFDRRIAAGLSVDYGLSLERVRIDDDGVEEQFTLVGIPVGATFDTSDDLLNPTRGGRTRLRFTPYLETLGSTLGFYSTILRHAQYLAVNEARTLILAGRAGIGSIIGASTSNLPADKRFYAGGSGSVRGYALQSVGPLDAADEPLGGSSLVEGGVELRWRVFGDFGVVPFVDAGQVFDQEFPDLDEELLWAAGLGLRYFTAIGPVRADLAFPINPRDSDETFQVYFSLGQAF